MKASQRESGFTLIELIVVMGMLAIVLALAMPSLSPFFTGRTLEEEARRFLALTEYARSEAISRSIPMALRVDVDTGYYGLCPVAGYEFEEANPVEFHLSDGLCFDVDRVVRHADGLMEIVFSPDGSVERGGFNYLLIRDEKREDWVGIERADYGPGYVIRSRGDYERSKSVR